MSSSTIPVLFEMYRGDDLAFRIRCRDKQTLDPMDISGWTFRATMKRGPTDDLDDATAPVQVTGLAPDDAESEGGIYWLKLPNEQTRNLGPGLYYFDVKRELDNVITTCVYGRVRVTPDITRRAM